MTNQPMLKTIDMVRETIKQNNREFSIYQVWKKLPRKVMYQTYKSIIEMLKENNEILEDGEGRITYIFKREPALKTIGRDALIFNLDHYGAPLISIEKIGKKKIIPLEDLMINILLKYPEARFIEAIPKILLKNREKLDKLEIYNKAYHFGLINKIGCLLEISFRIGKKEGLENMEDLETLLEKFRNNKEDSIQSFNSTGESDFIEKTTPDLLRKWNLIGRFFMEDFHKKAII